MRKIVLAGTALLLLGGGRTGTAAEIDPRTPAPADTLRAPAPAPEQTGGALADLFAEHGQGRVPGVRVWTEDERDLFRAGDRTRILLRTTGDAYVTVLHVSTRGDLEVLFPASPYDEGFVRGQRLYSIPSAAGASRYWRVSGSPGIGYVYAVASDQPLDLRAIRGLFSGRTGVAGGSRTIYGDPFEALDQIASRLAGRGGRTEGWYTYYIGQRYSFPRYACYDSPGPWYEGTEAAYGGCDRVRTLLRGQPGYYDTRTYHGDRRVVYARANELLHRYKEQVDPRRGEDAARVRPAPGGSVPTRPASGAPPPRRSRSEESGRQASPPVSRPRPTLERRRPEPEQGGRSRERPNGGGSRESSPREREWSGGRGGSPAAGQGARVARPQQ
jgi:hypothetical protein